MHVHAADVGVCSPRPGDVFITCSTHYTQGGKCNVFSWPCMFITGVCALLLQDLLQSCSRGGGRIVEDCDDIPAAA